MTTRKKNGSTPRARRAREVEQATEGAAPLGFMINFRLKDVRGTPRADALKVAEEVGMDSGLVPEPIIPARAFREVSKGLRLAGYITRPVRENDAECVWAIVREQSDGVTELRHAQQTWVRLRKADEKVETNDPSHPGAQAIEASFRQLLGTVRAANVREMIEDLARMRGGIKIGTQYFVPGSDPRELRAVREWVNRLGGSEMYLLAIQDTSDSRSGLETAARSFIEDDLREMEADLVRFQADPPRAGTIERRVARFEELDSQASLYEGILASKLDDLRGKIGAAKAAMAKVLLGVDAPLLAAADEAAA